LLNCWADFIWKLASAVIRGTNIFSHTWKTVLRTVFHQLIKYYLSYTQTILDSHKLVESLAVHKAA